MSSKCMSKSTRSLKIFLWMTAAAHCRVTDLLAEGVHVVVPEVVVGVVQAGDHQPAARHLGLDLGECDLCHGGEGGVDVEHGDAVNILHGVPPSANLGEQDPVDAGAGILGCVHQHLAVRPGRYLQLRVTHLCSLLSSVFFLLTMAMVYGLFSPDCE